MLRVQPSRWDTKVQASSIGSTSASSENPRCAMYKHCGRPCDRRPGHPEWIVGKPEVMARSGLLPYTPRLGRKSGRSLMICYGQIRFCLGNILYALRVPSSMKILVRLLLTSQLCLWNVTFAQEPFISIVAGDLHADALALRTV